MNESEHQMAVDSSRDSRLPLSDDEERILALYDKLQELRLEIAIINAQHAYHAERGEPTEDETKKASYELLQARAKYKLRNDVVEAVMTANPILKAVHNGTNASPVERHVSHGQWRGMSLLMQYSDLLPLVARRDEMAQLVARDATDIGDLRRRLSHVQSETLRTTRKNVELAAELLELTEQVTSKKRGRLGDSAKQQELAQAQTELNSSKRRWRIMKGVASGIVAGSGVNWALDDELCEIVLDPQNEND
ncbi:hypothetical protein HJFPF1_00778 [Paramyrothecium foliicola]|nr:hypothetical protein HJFPF1_00778 [Paramyrothecium foliicola]